MIELRSDTFTLPTPAMLRAMGQARLGDDVYGEDPTVRELEEKAAQLLGKEAGCLMPSGTMANLASIMTHAPRGSKVLVGTESDIYVYEAGGASVCGGVVYEPVVNRPDGTLPLADLRAGFPDDPEDPQFALPSLICLENTQNRCGGVLLSFEYQREVRELADERGIGVHLDGARIFNAAVALGRPPADLAQYADSVQFCLSKGLSAPIGSMVVGSADFVRGVRRVRKMLGGGMRQAGLLAAAGLVALDDYERLAEDHDNALRLAKGLADIDGITVDPDAVQTNIVMFRVTAPGFTWQIFADAAARQGLAIAELGHGRLRAVTHRGVDSADIDAALTVVRRVIAQGAEA
ncbi:GntG family PLP-dependent aldolase [Streptomyces azureus]|uniref:Threonine aldolase n=1 Tax=Streptomyces azureus TaxID=146537 RepID=A0A0K8PM44_STRAJ|nr:GntG family PLP-dependent aldolase [Streptomyces azureus]GAP48931.1 threonine aldolase [Streptomyces azureus]